MDEDIQFAQCRGKDGRRDRHVTHHSTGSGVEDEAWSPDRFQSPIYSADEPPHVHVERENSVAKIWLDPVRLERNIGFRAAELRRIERIVVDNQSRLLEAWHDYFES